MTLLVFTVEGTRVAVNVADVCELAPAVTIVPLPNAPPIIEGVINVHGRVVPVLDIRARFGWPRRALAPSDHLIVARAGSRLVALRADRALDLVAVDPDDYEDTRTLTAGAEPISGVAKLQDGLVLIHDLQTFLKEAEAVVLDTALGALDPTTRGVL
jgi:purine-binding chemotaxis protein CheW